MSSTFKFIREQEDDGLEDIFDSVKQLTGQFNDKTNTAVLQNDINLQDLTGIDTDDIKAIHSTLQEIIKTIGGQ